MSKSKEAIKRTEEWLNERYNIWEMTNEWADLHFYRGALKAVEFMGYEWRRNEDGKHTILSM